MSKYLFLFTIGPVQRFISQSRKTQDLYAGSYLLSYLCKFAAEIVQETGDIIFPSLQNSSIPNRFIAIVNMNSDKLKLFGYKIEGAVRNEFKKIVDSSLINISVDKPEGLDKQINSHLAINWVFSDYDENDYLSSYKKIERNIGRIKNIRTFTTLNEEGRKCSICGERNVKFYRKNLTEEKYKNNSDKLFNNKLFNYNVKVLGYNDTNKIPLKYLQPGEGLCGICFIKRIMEKYGFKNFQSNFPSTADISIMDALNKIPDKSLLNLKYDAEYILLLKEKSSFNNESNKLDIKDELKNNSIKIFNTLKENQIGFSPYYSILVFDGDSMGEILQDEDISDLFNFHKLLTKELGEFAKKACKILSKPNGTTIYTGGDDFLGFVNLKYLFPIMKKLREKFNEINLSKFTDKKITFSAGVAIAHYKTPLSEVIKQAQKMEQAAKKMNINMSIKKKDAFGIAVLKHSGEIHKTVLKWKYKELWATDVLQHLIESLISDTFSNNFIQVLNGEFARLMNSDGFYDNEKIVECEMKRLIERSYMLKKGKNESKIKYNQMKNDRVSKLFNELIEISNSTISSNFLYALNIGDFIAREVKM